MFKRRSDIFCFSLLLLIGFPVYSWGQTVGSNYSKANSFTNFHIQQAIGQPYAIFQSTDGNKIQVHQGQILPVTRAISPTENFECTIYPNPVVEETTVSIHSKSAIRQITIFDIKGTLIDQFQYQSNQSRQKINLGNLSPGVYMLKVSDKNGNQGSYKVTKISTSK